MFLRQSHISSGGNRHPDAADWRGDVLAFGSGKNVAIWTPGADGRRGVQALLRGHTDAVQAVRILDTEDGSPPLIITGSADKTVRLWSKAGGSYAHYVEVAQALHEGSVNTIAVEQGCNTFVTGAADAVLRICKIVPQPAHEADHTSADQSHTAQVRYGIEPQQTVTLRPRFLPLTTALTRLRDGLLVLAVAGTSTKFQLYSQMNGTFKLSTTLSGHEGWIRSLTFTVEATDNSSDVLLASASQDKFIRLWRVHKGADLPGTSSASQDPSLGTLGRSLSNKPHYLGDGDSLHSITFEALLIGHEDWIYTAKWQSTAEGPVLLSTSADNSVSVWKKQADSGFWICETRLGEISVQKGSTTATGSTGGFWIGLWSPDGQTIASLGRTGSWRLWQNDPASRSWVQQLGISGHTKEVKGLAWAPDGSYLLTTGSDQTTRLLGPWTIGENKSWHEVARPQIHGYDLNSIDIVSASRFISGADEKLLRVFNKPKTTAMLLARLAGVEDATADQLPDTASMPVLGLSNKIVSDGDIEESLIPMKDNGQPETHDEESESMKATVPDHPPFEDQLSRQTLWPEHEKLYGHGYEISAVAASHDGELVATACRASSIDHAVIRLFETTDWREIKLPLSNHSLTVTSLAFSPSDDKLLSVGRDRQWSVFERTERDGMHYQLMHANPKGHSRMILDCAWVPSAGVDAFATAGRDKSVKLWTRAQNGSSDGYTCTTTLAASSAVTAVAISSAGTGADRAVMAWATEEGEVHVAPLRVATLTVEEQVAVEGNMRPSGAVNALRWRPGQEADGAALMLAVASDDHSVRLLEVGM